MRRIKLILYACCFLSGLIAAAQKKQQKIPAFTPANMTAADIERLSKMSPEELEKYKETLIKGLEQKASSLASQGNLSLDESMMQSSVLRPPARDLKRLSALPSVPPTRQQLLIRLMKASAGLKKMIGKEQVAQLESVASGMSSGKAEGAAISSWIGNKREASLLMGITAVQKNPENLSGWNNLAAMFTMCGLESEAIPILQYGLTQKPGNSMMLNNLGQAYLGLGDLAKATEMLTGCLSVDNLNPEANRSMGMICLFRNEPDKAADYFAKEAQMANRPSSLSYLNKAGLRQKLNMAAIRNKRLKQMGQEHDFFEEIELAKFVVPDFPAQSEESLTMEAKHIAFQKATEAEAKFWILRGVPSEQESRAEGKKYYSPYFDLANELAADLDKTFLPLLSLFTDDDYAYLKSIEENFNKKMEEVNQHLPSSDGVDVRVWNYRVCNMLKPVIDAYVKERNSFVKTRIAIVQPRWKEYLNEMISIAQLDPSLSRKSGVYHFFAQYLEFLGQASRFGAFNLPPMQCDYKITKQELEALLMTNHQFDIKCPEWMQAEVNLYVAKMKLDCESFALEGEYDLLQAGIEKKFKTSTTTLWVGAGVDAEFAKYGKIEMTQKLYVVWDQNNNFSDAGISGTGAVSIDKIGSVELGYDFGMNAGFNSQTEVKNELRESYEKAMGYVGNVSSYIEK